AREPRGARRCAEQGEARRNERNFSEEIIGVEHDGRRRESRSRLALGTAMTLGRRSNERQLSKTAGVRKDINGSSPCADGAPGEGMQQGFLIQGRRFCNVAKEVDLGSQSGAEAGNGS